MSQLPWLSSTWTAGFVRPLCWVGAKVIVASNSSTGLGNVAAVLPHSLVCPSGKSLSRKLKTDRVMFHLVVLASNLKKKVKFVLPGRSVSTN